MSFIQPTISSAFESSLEQEHKRTRYVHVPDEMVNETAAITSVAYTKLQGVHVHVQTYV